MFPLPGMPFSSSLVNSSSSFKAPTLISSPPRSPLRILQPPTFPLAPQMPPIITSTIIPSGKTPNSQGDWSSQSHLPIPELYWSWWTQEALTGQSWSYVHFWSHEVDPASFAHQKAGRDCQCAQDPFMKDLGLRGPLSVPSWLGGPGEVTYSQYLSFPACE